MAPSQTAGAEPAQTLTEPDPGLWQGGLAPARAWLRRKGQNAGPWSEALQRWPGVLLCCVIALAASFVAGLHSGPQLLYALLFGISLHFLCGETKAHAGIGFRRLGRARSTRFRAPALARSCSASWFFFRNARH